MNRTSRRNALKIAGAGSLFAAAPVQAQHQSISDPLSNATVSFGQWITDPPLDRFLPFTPPTGGHHVTPQEVTIKAAGSVNFIISGFHLVLVYGAGTQPGSINVNNVIPGVPPLINDPTNRIYPGTGSQNPAPRSRGSSSLPHSRTVSCDLWSSASFQRWHVWFRSSAPIDAGMLPGELRRGSLIRPVLGRRAIVCRICVQEIQRNSGSNFTLYNRRYALSCCRCRRVAVCMRSDQQEAVRCRCDDADRSHQRTAVIA